MREQYCLLPNNSLRDSIRKMHVYTPGARKSVHSRYINPLGFSIIFRHAKIFRAIYILRLKNLPLLHVPAIHIRGAFLR